MFLFFFFNDTATTEIYTLSLHDALPISLRRRAQAHGARPGGISGQPLGRGDRKSTRLNSSHSQISYAVFCLKKKIINPQLRLHHALQVSHRPYAQVLTHVSPRDYLVLSL